MASLPQTSLQSAFAAAKAQFDRGDLNGAAAAFDQLATQAPNAAPVAQMQGQIALRLGFPAEAARQLARADRLTPRNRDILKQLVAAQEAAGEVDAAYATYDQLIALDPKSPEWLSGKILLMQQVGALDKAARLLRRAIKKMPEQAFFYRMLTSGEKLKSADPLITQMQKRLKAKGVSARDRSQFGYALAKVMSDQGRHDQVFAYLNIANAAEREMHPFDFKALKDDAWALIHAQADVPFPVRTADDDFMPIFLVGTPRSGTTLIERVLAAHPQASGIGESALAMRGIPVLLGQPGAYRPLGDVPQDTRDGYARAVERHARRMGAETRAVVDKSMNTHRIMGAIRVTMPNARFVVIDRDPRDVALSIYRNTFPPGQHRYANDLGDIARYIHDFREGVAFWTDRLPEAPHVVNYEAFVGDPETQTRALIEAVGLPWDDACLRPHETKGSVKTLSFQQVRQPIYKTSARGWEKYAKDLHRFDEVWEALNGSE